MIARKFDSKAAPYRKFLSDPISLVAAEIHLGKRPAGVYGGWLTLPYSNRVPVQQFRKYVLIQSVAGFAAQHGVELRLIMLPYKAAGA